jgi:hypothetical protein
MACHDGVVDGGERGVQPNDIGARLDQQAPRAARDAQCGVTIDGCALDEMTLVLDTASREKLSRARARRSAVAIVEDDARHGDAS